MGNEVSRRMLSQAASAELPLCVPRNLLLHRALGPVIHRLLTIVQNRDQLAELAARRRKPQAKSPDLPVALRFELLCTETDTAPDRTTTYLLDEAGDRIAILQQSTYLPPTSVNMWCGDRAQEITLKHGLGHAKRETAKFLKACDSEIRARIKKMRQSPLLGGQAFWRSPMRASGVRDSGRPRGARDREPRFFISGFTKDIHRRFVEQAVKFSRVYERPPFAMLGKKYRPIVFGDNTEIRRLADRVAARPHRALLLRRILDYFHRPN